MNAVLKKLVVWLVLCLFISTLFFRELWTNIGTLLSFDYIQSHGAYSWFVLLLCFLWIWMKRVEIRRGMQMRRKTFFIAVGLIMLVVSLTASLHYLPSPTPDYEFVFFLLLLACLGIFAIFFGEACLIPSALLGIYCFALVFPLLISRYFGTRYSLATVLIVVSILTAFDYPITSQGQLIHIHSPTNDIDIFAFIDAACSGSVSLGVFIAIFALMMIDIMLPAKKAASLFIFGVIGTSVQNILRLVVLILAGYYYGSEALLTAHIYAGYVIFPIWYAFFAYVYLRQVFSSL
jgi:exosortase/archaeosortase family protein